MFDFDYIFGTVPEKHIFFDWDKFHEQDTRFLTGAMNCADGKTIWFEKDTLKAPFMACIVLRAAHHENSALYGL